MCDADAWVALVHGYIELAPIRTRLSRTLSFAGEGVRCEAKFLRDGEDYEMEKRVGILRRVTRRYVHIPKRADDRAR